MAALANLLWGIGLALKSNPKLKHPLKSIDFRVVLAKGEGGKVFIVFPRVR